MNAETAYNELVKRSRERAILASCLELMGWDELTYMPRGGVENRGRQMAYLAGLDHAAATNPQVGELLNLVENSSLASDAISPCAVNVCTWRRLYERLIRVPRLLVEEIATVNTIAQREWAEARQNNDYARFLPWLQKLVHLKQQEAACLSGGEVSYDALLEDYEVGASAAEVTSLFTALRSELSQLLGEILAAPKRTSATVLHREYPLERQKIFAEAVASDLGFDFDRGRLDSTTHPFYSTVGPGDCRITTRYNPYDFCDAFFSMLHEMGHGLYEQGLPAEHFGTPRGESASTSIHESQSQIWEKFIGRGLPFWKHFYPRARDIFHHTLHDVKLPDFHRAINHVEPGWNRVRADAVTYDLHVMVRFELEQALISGELAAGDVPGEWNEKYEQYLGVSPATDTEGCLQDGHWSAGMFGYFPVYTLGNIYAAQIMAAANDALGNLDECFARGQFTDLLLWLSENLFRHGQTFDANTLIQRMTGQPISHRWLVNELRGRYAEIYGL